MPSATFTVSSGSERVRVYPEGRGTSSGGSGSVHSPTSSGGRSVSSRSTESWSEVEAEDEDDGIEPSDSASRSRHPASRRHTTEVRPAPTRRHSSRRVVLEREEESPPPRPRRRATHTSSRHRRAESRRTPSDESGSVASYDDYPHGHPGAPQPPRVYPQQSGYRHVPPQPHGGYPPSVNTSQPYMDPFAMQQRALVPMPQHDAFGYQPNPFTPQSQQDNPFSPISSAGGNSYFAADPHAPSQHPHRPPGPPRPHSMVGPSSHYGSEMAMSPYAYSAHPGMGMPPAMSPYGYPAQMPPWGYPPPAPPPHTSSPAPPKEDPEKDKVMAEIENLKAALQSKDEAEKAKATEETESLKKLIKKYEEAQAAAEAAALAKKAEEEAEKKKKAEIAEATKKVKEAAEKKAEEETKKAKEAHEQVLAEAKAAQEAAAKEHAEKLAESKKAQEDLEKAKKDLEDEAAKNKPAPDMLKAPIKFKDAVGRKFSFPFHLCKTWKGMETLIKQAFLHVDVIGEHVHSGHYDLTGPDGEIILPQVWGTMIQPDWEVSMHMWPLPEPAKEEPRDEPVIVGGYDPLGEIFGGMSMQDPLAQPMVVGKKPKKGKEGKGKKKSLSPEIVNVMPAHMAGPGGPMPPPPIFPPGMMDPLAGIPGGLHGGPLPPLGMDKQRPKAKSKGSKDISPFAAWFAGGQKRPKKR